MNFIFPLRWRIVSSFTSTCLCTLQSWMNLTVKNPCLDEICCYLYYSDKELRWRLRSEFQAAFFGSLFPTESSFICQSLFQAEALEQPFPILLPVIWKTLKTFSLLFRARKLVTEIEVWPWFICPHTKTFKQLSFFLPVFYLKQNKIKQIF